MEEHLSWLSKCTLLLTSLPVICRSTIRCPPIFRFSTSPSPRSGNNRCPCASAHISISFAHGFLQICMIILSDLLFSIIFRPVGPLSEDRYHTSYLHAKARASDNHASSPCLAPAPTKNPLQNTRPRYSFDVCQPSVADSFLGARPSSPN